jgi:hypothetical protein
MNIKRADKLVVASVLAAVVLALLILALSTQSARAQGAIYVHKQLGRADNVVHVGEYLTFTIEIVNNAAFDVITLPLTDTFNSAVLAYHDAAPCAPDSIGTDWLHWDDLTDCFGDLVPGQQIIVVVGFIAEHPQPAVVNYAEVHDAEGSGGALGGATGVSTDTESIGGASPVDKELWSNSPDGSVLLPQVGMPLTFTVVITNDGYTTMTVAPLVDTFDTTWLAFSHAAPPPDQVDAVNGVLTWDDVIGSRGTGPVPPHGTIAVTTVFTALAPVDGAMGNSAEVAGATDWYGNDLAGGSDQVPIIIIGGPEPTPTDTPTPTPPVAPTQPVHTQPAPTPVIATATPELTAQVTPAFLPESGRTSGTLNGILAAVLLAGVVLAFVLHHSLRSRTSGR